MIRIRLNCLGSLGRIVGTASPDVRGCSWNHEKEKLRCAPRIASDPQRWNRNDPQIPKSLWWNTNSPFVGFRMVRPVDPPSKKEQEKLWKETLDQFYYE